MRATRFLRPGGRRIAAAIVVGLVVAVATVGCASREPLEPLEPISAEDLALPPERERPGQIQDIPLDREPSGDVEPVSPVPQLGVPRGWKIETGVDRPRGDLRVTSTPEVVRECRMACEKDAQCRAFTFKRPASSEGKSYCTLKFRVTEPVRCVRCTSGVKP